MNNLVIAGSGPAGLTAAVYAARADLKPLVVEGAAPGGQLTVSHEVENFPGFPQPLSGAELIQRFKQQAEGFGAEFISGDIALIDHVDSGYSLTVNEYTIETKTLIIATGAQAKRLPIASEAKYYGKGVSGCATCDGSFFRDRDVLVIGGGNTAMEDARFLTRFAKTVTIVHRREYFRATAIEVEKTRQYPKIKWMIPWTVEEITGDALVTGAILKNTETDEVKHVACEGIFAAIGHNPKTDMVKHLVTCDEHGFIRLQPGSTCTSAPGIFACGDVCDPVYKQAIVAAGTGCMAALDAQHYLEEYHSQQERK